MEDRYMREGFLNTNSNTQKVTETINHRRGKSQIWAWKYNLNSIIFPFRLRRESIIEKHANHHFGLLSPYRWHQEITYNKTVLCCEFLSNQPSFCYNWLFYLIAKLQKNLSFPHQHHQALLTMMNSTFIQSFLPE